MKYLAVILNLPLIGGILYLIFDGGLSQTTRAILGSILLTALCACDLMTWGIASGRIKWKRRNDNGLERRSFFRVVYAPQNRPWLKVSGERFQVADISQRGLRFVNDKNIQLSQRIQGIVTFSDGQVVVIKGNVEWKRADEISLLLEELLPHTTISKERNHNLSP
jgi:hypothetical protein